MHYWRFWYILRGRQISIVQPNEYMQKDAPFEELSDGTIIYLEMFLEGSLRKDSMERRRLFPVHPRRR